MVCAVDDGAIMVRSDEGGEKYYAVTKGIAEVLKNVVTLLLESTPEKPEVSEKE